MAETAVSFALGQVIQILADETNLLGGIHKEFSDIRDELESIQAFLKDADTRAADEANTNDGIRTWVKQVREASFRIEDVIDEYLRVIHVVQHLGCGPSIYKITSMIRTLISRHQIVTEIQDIKLSLSLIKERSERYKFQVSQEQPSSSSTRGREESRWHDPRMGSLFIEETEIVGFDFPRDEMVGWLLKGTEQCTVISVVGMGGLGKTTLAKHVFDSENVKTHFDCRACITVSQSYTVRGLFINDKAILYEFQKLEDGSTRNSRVDEDVRWTRLASHFIEDTEVVGFESPRDELIDYLIKGTNERSLISIVGMGGLGKTTLANHVYHNPHVKKHFHCRSFITVSRSYTMKQLWIDMIKKFCSDANEPRPKGLRNMDDITLVLKVNQYLQSKRYLVLFDDVWEENFSDKIQLVLPKNDNGGRIIITTRMMHVAEYCKKSFPVHVHKLQQLDEKKAWELFCKKAFRRDQCPTELEAMSKEIVEKCGGLPLAIVAIGGLLSTKEKTMSEWKKLTQNLRMELERDAHLTPITRILSLSYDDLPHNLKSCMLYFGMYPEDYSINRKRLTRQWMAEGFVQNEERRPIEDVAEEYLTELIHRSLVHVSRAGFDGKVKSCQVHDLLREVIIRKMKDASFCHLMHEDDELDSVGITRRFSIATCSNNVLRRTSNQSFRAVVVFNKSELPEDFVGRLSSKFKLLKVLDFQDTLLNSVPSNLGNLFHLRYLNLSHTKVEVLPRSIGKLVNLETLDLRQTRVHELPREINNLTKLRLLPVYYRKYEGQYTMLNFTDGVKMQKGIGSLKSLQKLHFLEADHGGLELMQELEMLNQLRKLGIRNVKAEYASALSTAIGKMRYLESLNVTAIPEDEIIDLDFVPPPNLRVLNLKTRVTKLPDWIPQLGYLVKLRLGLSNLQHDPLDSLKDLPNLLRLNLWDNAYAGESLHFKIEGFRKLKELDLTRLSKLNSVRIDEGALLCLEHFRFKDNPQMKEVPRDLEHLKNLKFLGFADMPIELVESIDPEKGGKDYSVIKHISLVLIRQNVGPGFNDYELRPIPTLATV